LVKKAPSESKRYRKYSARKEDSCPRPGHDS
jgi:hypothetical protein